MFIKKAIVTNFKCVGSTPITLDFHIPNGKAGSGLNIFVGENNSGKSTFFESLFFLKNGISGQSIEDLKNQGTKGDFTVEAVFGGNIEKVIQSFSDKKFLPYVIKDNNEQELRISRSSTIIKITQSGREVELNHKKIGIWNSKTNQFENPSGIDRAFTSLFEADFIWADTNPTDEAKFGSTTICGKLLRDTLAGFADEKDYQEFQTLYKKIFNGKDGALKKRLNEIEEKAKQIFESQFGLAQIKFHFDDPDIATFLKIHVLKLMMELRHIWKKKEVECKDQLH